MDKSLLVDEILENISDGVIIVDAGGKVTHVNCVAEKSLGIKAKDAIDKDFSEVFSGNYIDTGAVIQDLCKKSILLNKKMKLDRRLALKSAAGKDACFLVSCTPLCDKGAAAGAVVVFKDVTKVWRLEERIIDKRHVLRNIFDFSPIGMITFDLDGRITRINTKALEIMKMEYSKVLNRQIGDAFGCKNSLGVGCGRGAQGKSCLLRQAIHKAIESGKSSSMEFELDCLYKERERMLWMKISVTPFRLEGLERILMTMIDISPQKQRELAIKESLKFHYQIIAGFPGLVWLKKGKKITYVNQKYEEYVGKKKEELVEIDSTGFVHPEDRDIYRQRSSDSNSGEAEIRIRNYEGEYRWFWCINRPFYGLNGNLDGSIGIAIDITDKKTAELIVERNKSQYHSLFMNMHGGFTYNQVILNEKGEATDFKHIESNKDYMNLFGGNFDDFKQKNFSELHPDIYREQHGLILICGAIAKAGEGRIDKEFYCAKLKKWLAVSVYSFEKGFFAAIFTDITERKNYEEKLKEATRIAEDANRTKSQFLANMSHEIRTPLNGMLGMIDLTLLTGLLPEQQENLRIAKSCANSLLILINDILDFSKMEVGRVVLENIPFDLKQLIEDVIKTHSNKALEKGLDFFYKLPVNLPQAIMGDPVRITQILHNLIANAIKFTQSGGIIISIKRREEAGAGEFLIFSVEDTGIGIDDGDRDKLFKAFSQVDGSITRRFGGTGLGLMITKQLVEMMGGKIWVDSQMGKGSNFCFSLPIQEVMPEELAAKTCDVVRKNVAVNKLLLVEDDAVNQLVIGKMLTELGYEYQIAENGLEAVEITRKKKFDCILMDIQMPKLDGTEATLQIRSEEGRRDMYTPIIALTAYAIKGDREKFLSYGMDDYLSKPVKMADLDETIKRVASRQAARASSLPNEEDISDLLAYCASTGSPKAGGGNENNLLKQCVRDLHTFVNLGDYEEIEKQANVVKDLAIKCGAAEAKTFAFKMQMAARRENKNEVVEYMEFLSDFIEKF